MLTRFVLLGFLATTQYLAHAESGCGADMSLLMDMAPEEFNQGESGWRSIADIEGCEGEAADIISTYRKGLERHLQSLRHHEAQLRAAAGQNEAAIALLRYLLDTVDDEATVLYHKAEIAFLARDYDALVAARDNLLALPKPEGFDAAVEAFKQRYPDYPPPVWPTNLNVVEGFVKCFSKPYSQAYSYDCQPQDVR